ncbi:hypothetical protein OQZ29_10135 [Pedobacter agri]|uniref:dUTPase-like domain-containing protein n=2 Tax=Pedobacter agri TaxID=454586 RepID=A0A9X3I8R5_9SPHI|nr:hypothetical protein [Pedobacter agri]MCX3265107.1 hypothetical protein [Pedobacter agri]
MVIGCESGTLNDIQINEFCESSILISSNFEKNNIKQACYELRASNVYYDLSQKANNRVDLTEKHYDYILIKPKQSVVIITKEKLNIPHNCLARILTKGRLFSIGLSPVNTYADPGFIGRLGIIFFNMSNDYLKIKPDEAIAKIEFSVLSKPVTKAYHGQHGYETNIWPIPDQYNLTTEEIKSDPRILEDYKELSSIYGEKYTKVTTRLLSVEKRLLICIICYAIFILTTASILIYFDKKDILNSIFTFVLGLIASVFSTIIAMKMEKK